MGQLWKLSCLVLWSVERVGESDKSSPFRKRCTYKVEFSSPIN
jgi:hypothetical protein